MKKILLLLPVILIFNACTYEKAALPVPNLTCVTDTVKHLVPVVIGDDFFNPQHIEIVAGDTVKWNYSTGSEAHTSTCDGTGGTTLPSGGTTWDSGVLSVGGTYKTAINVPGTYNYICTIHGAVMSGTIVVKARCQ